MLDFKTALASGLSKEDIMAQLEAAEAELKAEANKNEALDMMREEVITTIADYLLAAGILPPETTISEETMKDIKSAQKDAEKEIKANLTALSFLSILDKKAPTTQLNPESLKITPMQKKSALTAMDNFDFDAWLKSL